MNVLYFFPLCFIIYVASTAEYLIHHWFSREMVQVLLIGGSTGTMLEALEVVGDVHDVQLGGEVSF